MDTAQEQTQSYSGGVWFWRNSGEALWPQGSPEVCPGGPGLPWPCPGTGGSWGRSVAGDVRRSCSKTIPPSPSSCQERFKSLGEEQAQAGISQEAPVRAAIAAEHWEGWSWRGTLCSWQCLRCLGRAGARGKCFACRKAHKQILCPHLLLLAAQ